MNTSLSPACAPGAPLVENALTVVAIGASAGGLAALRLFFGAATPVDAVAFVVVTHLPLHHLSYLAELLTHAGLVPAAQAVEGERLRGGRAYVMPPGRLMGLRDGVIFLEPKEQERPSSPKPIDFFMASLADDAVEESIGIVLSGTDHDGTVGLKAIKAAGGLTLAQTPATAEFPSMPQSAIDTGAVDLILAPEAMPAALMTYLGRQSQLRPVDPAAVAETEDETGADRLDEILALLRERTGNDYQWYRPGMLRRRLRRRMVLVGCDRLADYLVLLNDSPDEAAALGREFLIGVTDFFRDPDAWQALENVALPALLRTRNKEDPPFRAWTAGCSSGEESYSVAMLLLEQLPSTNRHQEVQVFGTDIDLAALAVARLGVYPGAIASTVSLPRLARFFERRGDTYVVRKELRDAVMFAPQNLVRDTPFSKLDLVTCRNVLMYFEPALQEQVLQLFHFALRPGGLLWLGKAESLGSHGALFEPVDGASRLFRRVGGPSHMPRGFAGLKGGGGASNWRRGITVRPEPAAELLKAHLAARNFDAAVLVDRDGQALHFQGDTGRYLAPQGDATLDLFRLVRQELRGAARTVTREALSGGGPAVRRTVFGDVANLRQVTLEADVVVARDNRGLIAVVFSEPEAGAPVDVGVGKVFAAGQAFDAEIEESRRELALALDDAERSNDELRIASEEASALNEELQSSNEELESSKEELQSLNEELATVNAELEDKIVEVARTADDLTNLLDSAQIATILLDRDLRIRRFTPFAATLFNLRPGDEGRLLSDMSSRVSDPLFEADARAVLDQQPLAEAELRSAGGGLVLRRLKPFLSGTADVEGVVATFVDITPMRAAARQLRQLTAILEDSNDAVFSFDLEGRILSWNSGAERAYGYGKDKPLDNLRNLLPSPDDHAMRAMLDLAHTEGVVGPSDADRRTRDGRVVKVSIAVSALRGEGGNVYAFLSTERDITERLRLETEMRFRRLADDIPALLRVENVEGMAEFVNQACADFIGQERGALLGRGWLDFVHPQDKERYLAEHAAAQAERKQLEMEVRLRRHGLEYRWMRSIGVPHFEPTGEFAGYVALMVDEEDRKRAEAELLSASQRKDEFLAMLAHELRNPLAPITSAVAILSRSSQADHRAEWAVGVIGRQADILAKLLDGLLDVARFSRGKTVLELAPLELRVVAERAVEISQAQIESRKQRLVTVLGDDLLVEADLFRLTQVFTNLLNNASKYTDEGGEIRLETQAMGDVAQITVSDNGAGMDEQMLPRVFDLFAQADRTLDRAKGGLGLGLTLVRQLVELHQGSVRADSDGPGKGSKFTVCLPLLRRSGAVPHTDAPAALSRPTSERARRVLVVDDNEDGARALATVLEMEGHVVSIASDGDSALEVATRLRPDVLLLDIGLPGLDGYEVARRLRGQQSTTKAKLIALTGYGQPEDVAKAMRAGFDLHFVKPVSFDALVAAVAEAPRLAG